MKDDPQKKRQHHHELLWVTQMVASAQIRGVHGRLVIHIEGGDVKRVVEERSHLPPPFSPGLKSTTPVT